MKMINNVFKLCKVHKDSLMSLAVFVVYLRCGEFHFKDANSLTSFISFEGTVLALLVSIFLSAFTIIDSKSTSNYSIELNKRRNGLINKIYDSILHYVLPSSFAAISLSIFEYYIISIEYIKIGDCLEIFITSTLFFFITYSMFSIYYLARDSIELSKRNFMANIQKNKL